MATMIDGESYLGRVMIRPLSKSGDIILYLWPLRCLKSKMGGPTFGVDVRGEEFIRFDPHGPRGHWHKGGYDKLGRPGASHTDFPEGLVRVADQVEWALSQIKDNGSELLEIAEYNDAAKLLDSAMVDKALDGIRAHLKRSEGLREQAIADKLIDE